MRSATQASRGLARSPQLSSSTLGFFLRSLVSSPTLQYVFGWPLVYVSQFTYVTPSLHVVMCSCPRSARTVAK